jgi:putative ABC transport system substrate-binding protein
MQSFYDGIILTMSLFRSAWARIILCFGLLLSYSLSANSYDWNSQERSVWIFQSGDIAASNTTYEALAESLAIAPIKLIRLTTNDTLPTAAPTFIIAIGATAADKVFRLQPRCPVLTLLVTESGFKELAVRYNNSVENAFAKNYSALVLEQPLLRYFSLGKLLVPNSKKVGVLIGPNTEYRIIEAETVAEALGLELVIARINNDGSPLPALEKVMANVDFFVAVPDTDAINQITARWVLELSYRNSTPVIGYSARYAESGALAGIFTTPQSLGRQAGQWLLESLVNPAARGQIAGPQDLQLSLNPFVAQANKLTIKSVEQYRQLLAPSGVTP